MGDKDLVPINNVTFFQEQLEKRTDRIPKQMVINRTVAEKIFNNFFQGETKFIKYKNKKIAVTINTRMQDLIFIYKLKH